MRQPVISLLLINTFLLIQNTFAVDIEHSSIAPLARHSLLLDIDRKGSLVVAVGERGHVLYSYDNNTWQQANVETRSTLTSIFLLDGKTGWAVGHDAVILKTGDGALNWKQVHQALKAPPLLDLVFFNQDEGIAIGAYGTMYATSDGGTNWQKKSINILNKELLKLDEDERFDLHLNSISCVSGMRCYIAAEAGYVLRTDNAGQSWSILKTPYNGSFFGTVTLSRDDLLIFGLKGHLYHSIDGGSSWKKIESCTNEMLTDGIRLKNGSIVVVGMAKTLLVSKDNGALFSKIDLKQRNGLSSVVELENGSLILTGEAGIEIKLIEGLNQGR